MSARALVRALVAATVAAGASACVAEVGDGACLDDCDGDVYRERDAFAVVVVGEPRYLCAAGVDDPRCAGVRVPLADTTHSEAGDGGQRGAVRVEDVRILAPATDRIRVHDLAATADVRAAFDLAFRLDDPNAPWRSVTPDAHDWSEVATEVTAEGPIYLTGWVSCRVAGCADAVGQGSFLGRTPPRPGALVEYRLAVYPIGGEPGHGYDLGYTVE